jgi:hypothetical protein
MIIHFPTRCQRAIQELPGVWTVVAESSAAFAVLHRHDDELDLTCTCREGRIHVALPQVKITASNGRTYTYHAPRPHISIADHRTGADLGREIARRLLPDATAWWSEAQAWRHGQEETAADQRCTLAALAALGRGVVNRDGEAYGERWRAEPGGAGRVSLQLSRLTQEEAQAVLRCIFPAA